MTNAFWRAGAPLAFITLSAAWFIAGLFLESVLGSSYTTRRFTTIYVNLLLALATLAFGLMVRSPLRLGIILCSATLAIVWFYAAFVSSAV
jgi:hypothetical protein